MKKRQRLVMACIVIGSLIYIILLQLSVFSTGLPTEPTKPEIRKVCGTSYERIPRFVNGLDIAITTIDDSMPTIYIVTPTYQRPERIAELTRLGQTLLLVSHIHWIIAEDSSVCSDVIHKFLKSLGLPFTHLASPMPDIYRKLTYGPRGVSNRRAALQWVKEHGIDNAVLYFLDDDNAIDVRLFEEMRTTQKVSMFPVGLIGKYSVSSPIVNKDGVVTGFYDAWPAGRKFQVDMAGFAVNVEYLKKQKKVSMPYAPGHEEDGFLKSLNIAMKDIEVKANLCTEILVWHTRTVKNKVYNVRYIDKLSSNIKYLLKTMKSYGVINLIQK